MKPERLSINAPVPELKLLGDNLEYLRLREGKTIGSFAKEIHYGRNYYAKLVDGIQNISLDTFIEIAECVNKDPSALLSDSFQNDINCQEKIFVKADYYDVVSKNARDLFTKSRITVTSISEVHRSTISRLLSESVKCGNPLFSNLILVANGLNVKLDKLFILKK